MNRGDIYYAELGDGIGCEQTKRRPVLIIQNNTGNKHSPTTIVAIITSKEKNDWLPTHVLTPRNCGLKRKSIIMLEQLRTIDKSRLQEYIGSLDMYKMHDVNEALNISLGLYD